MRGDRCFRGVRIVRGERLPRALAYAGDKAFRGIFTEADTAHLEATDVSTDSTTRLAAVVYTSGEGRLLSISECFEEVIEATFLANF